MTTSDTAIARLERIWLVLFKLFEELVACDIKVDASQLRDCKALLHLVRTSPFDPCQVSTSGSRDSLVILEESLEKAKREMISASLQLGEVRAKYWMERLSKAELENVEQPMTYGESRFFPGLPRGSGSAWARLTLQQVIGEGRVQEVAEQFGVLVEFEDDLHLIFEGEPSRVRKALADVFYLSQSYVALESTRAGS